MFKKVFIIALFLSVSFTTYSQDEKKTTHAEELPKSIYVVDWSKTFSFQSTSLKEVLKLNNFKFLIVDAEDIRDDFFTLDLRNFGRQASSYSYESYRDIDLYKHFPKMYDLRRIPWKYSF